LGINRWPADHRRLRPTAEVEADLLELAVEFETEGLIIV
jgi:hypothetical protein